MENVSSILVDLFIIFAAAKFAAEVFERLRQPPVIGELLVGIIIGPHALALIGTPSIGLVNLFQGAEAAGLALESIYSILAELGIIFLLFLTGLETRASDIFRVGGRAVAVAVLGVILPFALGTALILLMGHPTIEAIFVATAMVATSVGITARVLKDLGVLQSTEARIILGAAVIDDILGIMVLSVVQGLGTTGGLSGWSIAGLVVQVLLFTGFLIFIGTRVTRRYSGHIEYLRLPNATYAFSIALCLGLAALAGYIGLAAIIGAFLAGMVLAEASERRRIISHVHPVYEFLGPFFFVITGSLVDWRMFADPGTLGLAAAVTGLAIIGKLAGGALGGLGLRRRSAIILGVGMVPRGEVGFIVASIGASIGAIAETMFSVVIVMSVITTLVVPPVLKALYSGRVDFAAEPVPEDRPEARLNNETGELPDGQNHATNGS